MTSERRPRFGREFAGVTSSPCRRRTGPRLEWPLTHEQALEVAQWLKRCEKLHHKYVFEVLLKLKEALDDPAALSPRL